MFWNHRVLKRIDDAGTPNEEINYYIVEVFYQDDGSVIGWTEKEVIFGATIEELQKTLSWMSDCLSKPVLDEALLLEEAKAIREGLIESEDGDIFPSGRISDNVEDFLQSLDHDVESAPEPEQSSRQPVITSPIQTGPYGNIIQNRGRGR